MEKQLKGNRKQKIGRCPNANHDGYIEDISMFVLAAEGRGLQPFDPADHGDRILIYGSAIIQKNL
jgi:hypothetical protein